MTVLPFPKRVALQPWVRALVEDHFPIKMEIGRTIRHPDGREVVVISGSFWGEFGVSNWWTWREVKPGGALGREESGYGW